MSQRGIIDVNDIGASTANSLLSVVDSKRIQQGFLNANTLDRIKYFHQLLLEFDLLKESAPQPKSNERSKEFRQLGNSMFQLGTEFCRALEFYNLAICRADPSGGRELSIAYANRSAVYFEWKEYQLCRDNIDLARKARYPAELKYKIDNRDAECVKMLDRKNPKSKAKSKVNLNVGEGVNRLERKSPMFSYDKYHGEASLSLMPNPKVPFVVNCLDVKYSYEEGHLVVAHENLTPGQIIAVEMPIVHAMSMYTPNYQYTKCANCYEENYYSLLPCPSCTNTMYCSKKCMEDAKEHHKYECPISEFLLPQWFGGTLCMRSVLKAFASFNSTNELDNFLKTYNDNETEFTFDAAANVTQHYRYLHGLDTDERMKDNSKLLECYCKVTTFYHVLTKNTPFVEKLQSITDHDNLMKLLMHHIQIVNRNMVTCTQYQDFDVNDAGDDKSETIYAQGIYPFTSLLKHSCAPNVAIISNGPKIITYVTRVIRKGSKLMRSFGIGNCHYFQHTKSIRQKSLYSTFSLKCNCEACTNNWPPYYEGLAAGKLSHQYDTLLKNNSMKLDSEVSNLHKFLNVLYKYDSRLPCVSINQLQLRVHKIMKLKYGDISTSLKVSFKLHPLAKE